MSDHAHSPYLQHHFETPQQQFDAGKLGMWLFLATEILLFGGLFCAYAIYRANHPEIFVYAHQFLNKYWGGTNTTLSVSKPYAYLFPATLRSVVENLKRHDIVVDK